MGALPSILLFALLATCHLATAATLSISTVSPTASSAPSYTSAAAFIDTILSAHNLYRHKHNATALKWNTTLAQIAFQHAKPCIFAHTKHNTNGEDLAAGYANTTAAVDSWGNEEKNYDFSDPGFSEETGHFSQVVWKNTTTVGCGTTYCGGEDTTPGWYLVCEYWPAGNVEGQFKGNVQKAVNSWGTALGSGGGMLKGAMVAQMALLLW